MLNRARGCCATGLVVVEAKSDGLDAEPAKSLTRPRARRRPAKCADVLDPACAELVEVEEALYQHDLASRIGRSGERVGEAVGREVGAAGAAQVEVRVPRNSASSSARAQNVREAAVNPLDARVLLTTARSLSGRSRIVC